tara:strand:- start:476 stop:763 length:288 start_codon:yes stop_codon:yes gene_type:complete
MSTIGKKTIINFKELMYSLIIKISLFPLSTIKNKITVKNIKNDGINVIISNTFNKLTINILEKIIFSPRLPNKEKIKNIKNDTDILIKSDMKNLI